MKWCGCSGGMPAYSLAQPKKLQPLLSENKRSRSFSILT